MLEAASRLDDLLLLPFERDTCPDRKFSSLMPRALHCMLLISNGLVGQDMRHLDKICFLLDFANSLATLPSQMSRGFSRAVSAIAHFGGASCPLAIHHKLEGLYFVTLLQLEPRKP
jgi:hypothetical protein